MKILNYKRSSYFDEYKNQEIFTIELITKIYNEVLDNKAVKIELNEKEIINAEWILCFRQPNIYRFTYKIINTISVNKSNGECPKNCIRYSSEGKSISKFNRTKF